jgi:hypothetical protein
MQTAQITDTEIGVDDGWHFSGIKVANSKIACEATECRSTSPSCFADMLSVLSASMLTVLARDVREIQR